MIHATDSGITRERAQQLAAGLTASTFVEIAGARLAVTMTHPMWVNHAIQQFMRERSVPTHIR